MNINPGIIETITHEVASDLLRLEVAAYMSMHDGCDLFEISELITPQHLRDRVNEVALGIQIGNITQDVLVQQCPNLLRHIHSNRVEVLVNLDYQDIADMIVIHLNDLMFKQNANSG